MVSKRFLLTVLILIIIAVGAGVAVFFTKGYTVSPSTGTILGTGIISVTSIPDQASVFLDGRLVGATNDNIKSLPPKEYKVTVKKEGFIDWEKTVKVEQGLVADVKATLFRSIPTFYPLTYTGAENALLSPDGLKMIYIVPASEDMDATAKKKTGVWVWSMSDRPLTFNRGAEPHQIMNSIDGIDLTRAKMRWSPDSTQILLQLPDRNLLLNEAGFNDPPRDITATLDPTLKQWEQLQKDKDVTRLQLIKEATLQHTASSSAVLKWSPDETKFMYSTDGKSNFKVVDLLKAQTYDLFKDMAGKSLDSMNVDWLPDSEHLIITEKLTPSSPVPKSAAMNTNTNTESPTKEENKIEAAKIYIMNFDGFNKFEIYAGNIDPESVVPWPDSSRLVVVSSLPIATASKPNLYGINLK